MPKRTYAEFVAGSDTNFVVLTADGGRIPAHAEVLRLVCSCLKNAPSSDTWDLTQLLVEGTAPAAETVTAVFEVIYQGLQVLDFQMDKSAGRFSLLQLRDMLLFADAVGCSKGCIDNLGSLFDTCVKQELTIALSTKPAEPELPSSSTGTKLSEKVQPRQQASNSADATKIISLKLDRCYVFSRDDMGLTESLNAVPTKSTLVINEEEERQLITGTCQQLESLLHIAFKVGVKHLQGQLLNFLRTNSGADTLCGKELDMVSVLSPRVLSAACTGAVELMARACLHFPLGVGVGIGTVFKVADDMMPLASMARFKFRATMLQDMLEFTKGTKVMVSFNFLDGHMLIHNDLDGVKYKFGVVLGTSKTWPIVTHDA